MSTQAGPRTSTETERHLLADSTCASEVASAITNIDGDGDRTPRAQSPVRIRHRSIATPEQAHSTAPYRGFASEQAYLDALRSWAEEKRFVEPTETSLLGFYGTTTMSELASRPAVLQPLGIRKKWKAMRASRSEQKQKISDERRATIT